jgi:rubrerythrin
MSIPVIEILEEGRRREKAQTLFYRSLAARAERTGALDVAERLNALHADEQHHLSRLTARVLELGGEPREIRPGPSEIFESESWEDAAREREVEEVAWYREALGESLDRETAALLREILESEEHHSRELGGKWMSA